ncbi:class I SAM-dependent methyltransferase [Paraburkholderia rhizosphaerae]|uniref:Methyltransferase family protein n=1 Tax=Paraburkholderia rhizosphaerae TaxID=480658 RepID=A0A4R8L4F3_9BURK|nr:class I SAM-dependent methyltransferase [Paraburkholderia rhizosphaerae]TDY37145.1 methyltransferase family protein [Paraburkholderia rhizosphaerae]
MKTQVRCPACDSLYTLHVQDVVGRRTRQSYPQRFCMDCRSFFHRTGYVEDDNQQLSDFEFLFSHRENHYAILGQLTLELLTLVPGIKSVLEIGHGTGLFLKACNDFGLEATGFEVNPHCHRFAVEHLNVDSRLGLFDDNHEKSYDLIAAIQVFEHLDNPRDLFSLMRRHLNRDGAIYLSVPFVERYQWQFLWGADKLEEKHAADVFADNDVHITSFSIDGMKRMGLSLGARSAEYFVSQDVYHKSPGAYQGVLFRF